MGASREPPVRATYTFYCRYWGLYVGNLKLAPMYHFLKKLHELQKVFINNAYAFANQTNDIFAQSPEG
jgi:hypothetical protein